jgi:hypothetical protein
MAISGYIEIPFNASPETEMYVFNLADRPLALVA